MSVHSEHGGRALMDEQGHGAQAIAAESPVLAGTRLQRWRAPMVSSSLLLTIGSSSLLVGGFALLFVAGPLRFPLFIGPTLLAIILHLSAWAALGQGIRRLVREQGEGTKYRRALEWGFLGSLVGFGLGILALPLFVKNWTWILLSLSFPYFPTVYIPVVIGHAVTFAAASYFSTNERARGLLTLGGVTLFALGFGAIAGFITFSALNLQVTNVLVLIPGLTAIGYAVVLYGWMREVA